MEKHTENRTFEEKSILEMAMGAIQERVDYEMSRVVDNILDVNTKATGKRQVTVTVDLVPDDERKNISVSAVAKSKLQPTNPIKTSLFVTSGRGGELVVAEMVPQIPGQIDMQGGEQSDPKILKLAELAKKGA